MMISSGISQVKGQDQIGYKKKKFAERVVGISCPGEWWSYYLWKCPSNTGCVTQGYGLGGIMVVLGLQFYYMTQKIFSSLDYSVIYFQNPLPWNGHLPLDHVVQSHSQTCLKQLQGWVIHNFSVPPVPVPHHPHRNEFLPEI